VITELGKARLITDRAIRKKQEADQGASTLCYVKRKGKLLRSSCRVGNGAFSGGREKRGGNSGRSTGRDVQGGGGKEGGRTIKRLIGGSRDSRGVENQ